MPENEKRPEKGEVRQYTVAEDDEGVRLDRWFKRHLPEVGFATVARWARTGQIRVDGARAKPDDRLTQGQVLRIPPGNPARAKTPPRRRELTEDQKAQARAMVIKETPNAIVLNKPPGLATQGGSKTFSHVDGLLDAFVEGDGPRPRLVHRLDKDTSGVLLIARTPGSAAAFSKRFAGRSAKKVYWALVVGVPEQHVGEIDAPLAKQPGTGGEKMHVDTEGGQPAKTRYRVVERAGNRAAWLELEPLTGRTHQLRVHCAAMGHPIVGDGKYGGQEAFLTGSVSRKMHLHARRLIISQPGGGQLDVTAELPEHFAATMEQMGFDLSLSDAQPLREEAPPKTKAEKKQDAKQHAKQYRKARRGERRSRTVSKATAKSKARAKPKGKGGGKR
ncbi:MULTISPECIES: RluA family pseudouridine synthase [Sphingomonadales]|uniref:RluA family pseudouridine synthase n=1 Tax=Sphingomonadales TaxID=204457 RepID=UPI0001DD115F|nr:MULTISPECIES: RluA family pseudouridine synthase [Sphingomonadales]ALG60642.1 pseudouridine synthase [Citromicrobium sp. JL477]KPM14579.1 pseudouridine synthase [Citromicrobium sp. JL1351]KPM19880.1 pseudouridine synthase [Citromicrobium sp. JL31]KPM22835.1 pseudouridine synthase [Citromicrobium sp. JL2201]